MQPCHRAERSTVPSTASVQQSIFLEAILQFKVKTFGPHWSSTVASQHGSWGENAPHFHFHFIIYTEQTAQLVGSEKKKLYNYMYV